MVHLLSGRPLPAGWLGKPWACYQLSQAANGDFLLFVDADAACQPQALRAGIAAAQSQCAGLVTPWPRQLAGSWAERLVQPLQQWLVASFLPVALVPHTPRWPSISAASGQFMLFRRSTYEACGGHQGVRNQIVDDVALAQAVKRSGTRMLLLDGTDLVTTRMYRNFTEVWRGYSKNLFAALGRSLLALGGFVLFLWLLYVVPYLWLAQGLIRHTQALWLPALLSITSALIARLLLAMRFRYAPLDAFWHPLSIILFTLIAANSMRWHYSGHTQWKGRKVANE